MIQQIKELRVRIDGLHQLTKELKPIKGFDTSCYVEDLKSTEIGENLSVKAVREDINSQEIEDAAKSLLLAKAWLGKLLGELGSENPYSSGKKEVKDIQPIADTADRDVKAVYEGSWNNESHIEKVDWLRSEIQSVVDELSFRKGRTLNGINEEWFNYNAWNATNVAYNHLCEAKFWLGFEFQRIKEDS